MTMLKFCILKGCTTSKFQFKRFIESLVPAIRCARMSKQEYLHLYFYSDEEGIEVLNSYDKLFKELGSDLNLVVDIFKRNADPGDLRNEFISQLRSERFYESEGIRYFGFFDGDDQISENYFYNILDFGWEVPLMILTTIAVYGDSLSDHYQMKWDLALQKCKSENGTLLDLALEDSIGGQAWGKVYSAKFLDYGDIPIFGRGLYEDVRFWYTVASRIHEINEIRFIPSIYYWRRDNPSALTRHSPNIPSILQGLENLNYARDFAISHGYSEDDIRVWKRYTMGIVDLIKHIFRSELDGQEKLDVLNQISKNIKISSCRFGKLNNLDPGFIQRTDNDILKPQNISISEISKILVEWSGIVL